jgi:hypothetical protein
MHRLLQMPKDIHATAQQVESALSVGEIHAPAGNRTFQVGGEACSFPYRVYYTVERVVSVTRDLDGTAGEIALCLASRHNDGRIREIAIRNPSLWKSSWAIPFSVQLLGEYVVEIGKAIEEQIDTVGIRPFLDFAKENPGFVETTRRRAISYWDCYYRSDYVKLQDYPCYRAIQRMLSASRA